MKRNKDGTRMVTVVGFGYACYQRTGVQPDGDLTRMTYTHCGLVGTKKDANDWLAGNDPVDMKVAYQRG